MSAFNTSHDTNDILRLETYLSGRNTRKVKTLMVVVGT